jgi:muramoyltetrapeptide carboxypeptidase
MRIGIVAPSCRIDEDVVTRVSALAAGRVELVWHPQCFLSDGHFAGPDDARAEALIETANDSSIDAVWFARGGYGACRIVERVVGSLGPQTARKTFMGYSDGGTLLGALYARDIGRVVHGPMRHVGVFSRRPADRRVQHRHPGPPDRDAAPAGS